MQFEFRTIDRIESPAITEVMRGDGQGNGADVNHQWSPFVGYSPDPFQKTAKPTASATILGRLSYLLARLTG